MGVAEAEQERDGQVKGKAARLLMTAYALVYVDVLVYVHINFVSVLRFLVKVSAPPVQFTVSNAKCTPLPGDKILPMSGNSHRRRQQKFFETYW